MFSRILAEVKSLRSVHDTRSAAHGEAIAKLHKAVTDSRAELSEAVNAMRREMGDVHAEVGGLKESLRGHAKTADVKAATAAASQAATAAQAAQASADAAKDAAVAAVASKPEAAVTPITKARPAKAE